MCTAPVIEVPTVEARFYIDHCACHGSPREMVEINRPGDVNSTVYDVREARRSPGLWAALASRYAQWQTPLLTFEGQCPLPSLTSQKTLQTS